MKYLIFVLTFFVAISCNQNSKKKKDASQVKEFEYYHVLDLNNSSFENVFTHTCYYKDGPFGTKILDFCDEYKRNILKFRPVYFYAQIDFKNIETCEISEAHSNSYPEFENEVFDDGVSFMSYATNRPLLSEEEYLITHILSESGNYYFMIHKYQHYKDENEFVFHKPQFKNNELIYFSENFILPSINKPDTFSCYFKIDKSRGDAEELIKRLIDRDEESNTFVFKSSIYQE